MRELELALLGYFAAHQHPQFHESLCRYAAGCACRWCRLVRRNFPLTATKIDTNAKAAARRLNKKHGYV